MDKAPHSPVFKQLPNNTQWVAADNEEAKALADLLDLERDEQDNCIVPVELLAWLKAHGVRVQMRKIELLPASDY